MIKKRKISAHINIKKDNKTINLSLILERNPTIKNINSKNNPHDLRLNQQSRPIAILHHALPLASFRQ